MAEDYTAHEKEIEAGVTWTIEAWERVKHAPEFVRPGIRKLMVQRTVKRGFKYITSDFLTEIRNESMMLVSKRVKQFGFEELSMGAFDVAKQKMVESPRKVEVIEEIQDFLAMRTEKKEDIVDKRPAACRGRKMPWRKWRRCRRSCSAWPSRPSKAAPVNGAIK
jgi:hypothetical protein